jgi:dTDP-4-dehydrorhamnose reductase
MKIYIAGGGGMLGKAVYEHFKKDNQVRVTDIRGLDSEIMWDFADVRDYHQQHWQLTGFYPNVIMNLAAETDLEYCEGHGTEALSTNALGSAVMGSLAEKFGAKYVYISTAGIFDGSKDKFTEIDIPRPLSLYGKAKYYGELIAQSIPNSLVVRPGWMMGGGPKTDKKFINKIYKQLIAGATELCVVPDKAGTPTYTNDLAKQIDALVRADRSGIYNTTCLGSTNRYEVAKEFIRLMGLEDRIKVTPVASSYFTKEYPAPRPASEVLDTRKLEDSGLCVMQPWQCALSDYVQEFPRL